MRVLPGQPWKNLDRIPQCGYLFLYIPYTAVPYKGYHFHTGREALKRIGYDESIFDGVPEENIASFAGTGNPFALGPLNEGETVVDIGSGAGLDALIESKLVGPGGKVVGIDMTREMRQKAWDGVRQMGVDYVEFMDGLVEDLPLPDDSADVVISNGVLKSEVFTYIDW